MQPITSYCAERDVVSPDSPLRWQPRVAVVHARGADVEVARGHVEHLEAGARSFAARMATSR